jgi:hypothetical protein
MTLPGNGTTKKVIASVLAALCIFLISQVLATSNRVTAVETEMRSIKESLSMNRTENRDEHRAIGIKLDEIAKAMRK